MCVSLCCAAAGGSNGGAPLSASNSLTVLGASAAAGGERVDQTQDLMFSMDLMSDGSKQPPGAGLAESNPSKDSLASLGGYSPGMNTPVRGTPTLATKAGGKINSIRNPFNYLLRDLFILKDTRAVYRA